MRPGVDPKVDYAFKKLFGSESSKELLIDLLNAVLQFPTGKEVVEVELLNPFSDKETVTDKLAVLDVKARDAEQRLFNVEMQLIAPAFYPRRVLYYWSRVYGRQISESTPYSELHPTISISFVNSVLYHDLNRFHHRFLLMDPSTGTILSDDIEIHILELPRFTLGESELVSPLDRWCYFLRFAEALDSDQLPTALKVQPIPRALEVLTMLTQSEIEWIKYEDRLKAHLDKISEEAEKAKQAEKLARTEKELAQKAEEIAKASKAAEEANKAAEEANKAAEEANKAVALARTQGVLIGQVLLLQRMLKLAISSTEELNSLSVDQLQVKLQALEKQATGR